MAIIPTMDNEQTSPPHPPHAKLRPLISQLPNTHFLLFFSSPIYLKALLTRTKEKKQGKKSNKKSHVLKLFKAGISISGQPTRLLPSTPAMSTTSVHHTHPDAYAPPIIVILTVILLVFFFLGFFSVYFCRCFMGNLSHTWLGRSPSGTHGPGGSSAVHGLDPSIIDSFPTFVYSTVKDYREQKYGLECAICLSEFEDDDMLRLLTVCYHVFHHDCIDLWLGSHNTCPVCRRSLDVPLKSLEKSPANNNTMQDIDENESLDDECSIAIKDGDEECRGGSSTGGATNAHGLQIVENKEGKFSRSHSTGHSIAWTKGEEDKHTLILPEHVKAKITRGHNWSCTTFGDYSGYRNKGKGGVGEVSGFSGSNEDNV